MHGQENTAGDEKNCPWNLLDSIESLPGKLHIMLLFSPRGSRKYLAHQCQAWKRYSGHAVHLTHGGHTGPLRLPPHEKAPTSLDVFRDIFPSEATQTGQRYTFAQVRRFFFFF